AHVQNGLHVVDIGQPGIALAAQHFLQNSPAQLRVVKPKLALLTVELKVGRGDLICFAVFFLCLHKLSPKQLDRTNSRSSPMQLRGQFFTTGSPKASSSAGSVRPPAAMRMYCRPA